MYCFDFQKPLMGNNSGPEDKQHCGNPNCPYLHELPTNEEGETKLKDRHAKVQDRKKEKEDEKKTKYDERARGKGGFDAWADAASRLKGDGKGKGKGKWIRKY